MHFLAFLTTTSSLLSAASAVGIQICYQSHFQSCTTITGASGQCIYVGDPYNDHVYSARALGDTNHCDSYDNINDGACDDLLVQGIDQAGYSGLDDGDDTSAFVCYS